MNNEISFETLLAHTDETRELERTLRCMLLCTMLGNYPMDGITHRPSAEVRALLYQKLHDQPDDEWFLQMVWYCPKLLCYALREYLVYAIEDNPALYTSIAKLTKFEETKAITLRACNRIREYVQFGLHENPCSFLSQGLLHHQYRFRARFQAEQERIRRERAACAAKDPPEKWTPPAQQSRMMKRVLSLETNRNKKQRRLDLNTERMMRWHQELDDVLFPMQSLFTNTKFACPRRALLLRIRSLRERPVCRLVPLDGVNEIFVATKQSKKDKTKDEQKSINLLSYIHRTHYDQLARLVYWMGPERPSLLHDIIPYLCSQFGIDTGADFATALQRFVDAHANTSFSCSKTALIKHLRVIRERVPYIYNLLHAVGEVYCEYKRRVRIIQHRLPDHYCYGQLLSHQRKFGLLGSHVILKHCLSFVYCSVCYRTFSMLRDPHRADGSITGHNSFGMVDAVLDLQNPSQLFCNNIKHSHRGSCRDTPLVKLDLLGSTIAFFDRVLMLCPECSMPMVLDPAHCRYDQFTGYWCVDCTNEWNASTTSEPANEPAPKKCAVGGCSLSSLTPSQVYCFPFGLRVCERHFSRVAFSLDFANTRNWTLERWSAELAATRKRRRTHVVVSNVQ